MTPTLRVWTRSFVVFDETSEPDDALTLIIKLPISAPVMQDLSFSRESKGCYKQHDWVIAYFGLQDDVVDEIATLRCWLK